MKNLFRIWLALFLAAWILYVGSVILIATIRGQDIDLLEKCIFGVINAFVVSLVPIVGAYSIFPRIKYLESDDHEKPSFKVACSSVIDLPQGFDFNRLKAEISGKWLITFTDDAEQVLKFRTRLNVFKDWGTAAWLNFDGDTGKVYIVCFPMAFGNDYLARKMQKEIENCLVFAATV